ncbi:MAG TPA: PQQ-binding-like beta-propeller repeat protein, partial [Humisphaera sp.]|nr:PQQ-binding-like beta-propeller repeat protein [Humisphaera sp.]
MTYTTRMIGMILLGMTVCGASSVLATDWPQWRGANRDAKVTEFTPPAAWPKELKQTWKVTLGTGDATPALVGDKLYVFTRDGNDEVTTCLDAASGKQVWQDKYAPNITVTGAPSPHPGPRSSPAVGDGKIVTLGVGEMLSCLDAASGKMIWRKEFSKEFPKTFPRFYTATSPIIVDKMCVVHLGAEGNGAIMAFDLASGDVKWQWKGDGPAYGSPIVATIEGVKQIVEQTEKNIVGLNAADGKLLWQTPYGGGGGGMSNNTATPVIDGSTVIVSGRGTKAIKIEK